MSHLQMTSLHFSFLICKRPFFILSQCTQKYIQVKDQKLSTTTRVLFRRVEFCRRAVASPSAVPKFRSQLGIENENGYKYNIKKLT